MNQHNLPEGTLFHSPALDPACGHVAFIVRGRWWLVLQILPYGRLFGTLTGNGDEAVRRFLFLTGGGEG